MDKTCETHKKQKGPKTTTQVNICESTDKYFRSREKHTDSADYLAEKMSRRGPHVRQDVRNVHFLFYRMNEHAPDQIIREDESSAQTFFLSVFCNKYSKRDHWSDLCLCLQIS